MEMLRRIQQIHQRSRLEVKERWMPGITLDRNQKPVTDFVVSPSIVALDERLKRNIAAKERQRAQEEAARREAAEVFAPNTVVGGGGGVRKLGAKRGRRTDLEILHRIPEAARGSESAAHACQPSLLIGQSGAQDVELTPWRP